MIRAKAPYIICCAALVTTAVMFFMGCGGPWLEGYGRNTKGYYTDIFRLSLFQACFLDSCPALHTPGFYDDGRVPTAHIGILLMMIFAMLALIATIVGYVLVVVMPMNLYKWLHLITAATQVAAGVLALLAVLVCSSIYYGGIDNIKIETSEKKDNTFRVTSNDDRDRPYPIDELWYGWGFVITVIAAIILILDGITFWRVDHTEEKKPQGLRMSTVASTSRQPLSDSYQYSDQGSTNPAFLSYSLPSQHSSYGAYPAQVQSHPMSTSSMNDSGDYGDRFI